MAPIQPPAPIQPSAPRPPPVTERLIEQFLANQSQELAIRTQEIQARITVDNNQFVFATQALQEQAANARDERQHQSKKLHTVLVCGLAGLVAVLVFLTIALFTGNAAVVMEVIKAVVFIAGGGAGGYALGTRAQSKKAKPDG